MTHRIRNQLRENYNELRPTFQLVVDPILDILGNLVGATPASGVARPVVDEARENLTAAWDKTITWVDHKLHGVEEVVEDGPVGLPTALNPENLLIGALDTTREAMWHATNYTDPTLELANQALEGQLRNLEKRLGTDLPRSAPEGPDVNPQAPDPGVKLNAARNALGPVARSRARRRVKLWP